MGLKWFFSFFNYATPLGSWSTWSIRNGKQIQIEVVATFLIMFGAHMNISFIIKVRIPVLIKLTTEPSLRVVIIFWTLDVAIFSTHVFGDAFLEPHQTTYHTSISVWLRDIIESCTPTLGEAPSQCLYNSHAWNLIKQQWTRRMDR
jgi:hypothetical protein